MTNIDSVNCTRGSKIKESKMADRHHFEKSLNRHNSAMVRRIAMTFDGTKAQLTILNLAMDKNLI